MSTIHAPLTQILRHWLYIVNVYHVTVILKMATFLPVPLKQAYEVDVIKPIRNFIQNTFSSANPDEYNTAISEFSKLRNLTITKSVDKHESALDVLYR